MRFGVLGPLEVHGIDGAVRIRPGHTHRALCVLLSRANEYVSVVELIDAQWPDNPPASASQSTRRAIHLLRNALDDPARIIHSAAGYSIRLDLGELDAQEFAAILDRAHRAHGSSLIAEADEMFGAALRLWRGKPYAGLEDCLPLQPEVQRLTMLRTQALEGWATVNLTLGNHAKVLPVLAGLVEDDSRREQLVGLYMRALCVAGRPAEAQDAFWRTKNRLAEDLGADPTPALQQLYEAILRGKLELPLIQPKPPAKTAEAAGATVPAQLPADVYGFAGRTPELDQLDALLATDYRRPAAVVISAVSGTAGVGKTALAVHWAHRVAGRFPDGQLYVNLRGFDPTGAVVEPADAVRGFLDALEVTPQRIPVDLGGQAALYRTLLAGKRMLVVLDNARDADQIRPLLPGSPGCLALVTSRNDLAGLVVKEGARPLTLDILSAADARALLERRIGSQRIATETALLDDIIAACAGLPLALAIVAARAAVHPQLPLGTLLDDVRSAHLSLNAFAVDDRSSDVRTVFSWSYQQLTPGAARLFRFLGLHPGPDISAPAAISLAGMSASNLHQLMAELTRANLVIEHAPGRYAFHDLLRAYAGELSRAYDTDDDRHGATSRMLDHYLYTAYTADRLLNPAREEISLATSRADRETFENHHQAMAWFTREHSVLLGCFDRAAATGFDAHTWQLAWTIHTYLDRQGHWHDLADTWRTAVEAARRLEDQAVQAKALRLRAHADTRLGRLDDADIHLHLALTLHGQLGDLNGQASTHHYLAWMAEQQGQYASALNHNVQALALFRRTKHQRGQAIALNSVGWDHAHLSAYEQALAPCEEALNLFQELGDPDGEAATWDSLGYAHHHLGHHDVAGDCYQHALVLYHDLGHRYEGATTLTNFADTQHAAGNPGAARQSWQKAVTILDDLGHSDAEAVRAKLVALNSTTTRLG